MTPTDAVGMRLLKQIVERFTTTLDARHTEDVVVYVNADCRCCKEAIALLREHGIEPLIAQLDDYPEVRYEHGAGAPIVEIDGRVRFSGRVDPVLLRRLIRHRDKTTR